MGEPEVQDEDGRVYKFTEAPLHLLQMIARGEMSSNEPEACSNTFGQTLAALILRERGL